MDSFFLFYLILVIFILILSLIRSQNRIVVGFLTFWLLADPILSNPNYQIIIEPENVKLNTERIVLIPLFFTALYLWRKKGYSIIRPFKINITSFEFWLFVFILSSITAVVINRNQVGVRNVIIFSTNLFVFISIYLNSKWGLSLKDFKILVYIILTIAVTSTIISLIQFFIDPTFFQMGSVRLAFSNFYRANGLFRSEYDQSFFQIIALLLCLFLFKSKIIKISILLSTGLAVFFTMHRLSWFAYSFAIILYFLYQVVTSPRKARIYAYGIILLLAISFLLFSNLSDFFAQNNFLFSMTKRIQSDTLSVRMDYYNLAVEIISSEPLGIGSYLTPQYNQLAYNKRLEFGKTGDGFFNAFTIHNGFLASGAFYGYLGMLSFSLFVLLSIYNNFVGFKKNNVIYFLPLCLNIIFLIFNMTQDFSMLGARIIIFYGLIIGFYSSNFQIENKYV